jgi:hypothetical protein
MQNRLQTLILMAGAGAALALTPVAVQAQQTYRAPRTADGKPNLNGIWQAMNNANWDIRPHAAAQGPVFDLGAEFSIPPDIGVVEGGDIPYLPAAAQKQKENYTNRLKLDPEVKCYLPGVPRAAYMPYPFQIVQSAKTVMFVCTNMRAACGRYTWTAIRRRRPIAGWDGRTATGKGIRWWWM